MESPDETKPLILTTASDPDQYPPIIYNHNHRPLRDLPSLLLFLLLLLSTFSLGILASARRNPNRRLAPSFIYDPSSSSCIPPSPSLSLSPPSSSSPFLRDLTFSLLLTFLLSFPIAFSLLSLLRHFAKHLIYSSLPFFILTPIFLNAYWFAACQLRAACRETFPLAYRILVFVLVFFLIAIAAWIIVCNWHRIKLTVRVLQIASAALVGNLLLLVVLPCLALGLLVYLAPIVLFLVVVTFNGRVVAKEGGDGLFYCRWKQDRWVPGYFALAIVTMLWSFGIMVEAKVYVTSGTIAQWYFSVEEGKPRSSVRNSLRFGGSFGAFFLV